MGASQEALKTDRGGICRHRSFSLGKRATQKHLCSHSPLPYFRHSVRKPMLSRRTGCRQKTLQARQSACRWITITACLFIHVFICVFIFSLHCKGDKKCWLRQCHADTRKHLLGMEVVSLWRESWDWATRQQGNWSDCLPCLDGFFFF